MRKRLLWAALAVLAGTTFFSLACGGHSPTGPSVADNPSSSAGAPAQVVAPAPVAPAPTPGSSCSTEAANTSLQVLSYSLEQGTLRVKNNGRCPHWAGLALYQLVGNDQYNQVLMDQSFGEVPAGGKGTFQVTIDFCGPYQLDPVAGLSAALPADHTRPGYRGNQLLDVDAYGGNFGNHVCPGTPKPSPKPSPSPSPTCEDLNVQLSQVNNDLSGVHRMAARTSTSSTFAVTVNVNWNGSGTGVLDWGDSTSQAASKGQMSHNYTQTGQQQTFTVTLTVTQGELRCSRTIQVTIPGIQDPCDGVGQPSFSMTKSQQTTTATVDSKLTFAGGFTGSISISPAPVSGFSGGSVTSGADNNSDYNRPNWDQPSLTVSGSWQVRKSDSLCASGSGNVSVSPKTRTCDDVNLHAEANVDGSSVTISATWNGPGSVQVTLGNSVKNISSSGGSVTYSNLAAGDYTAHLLFSGPDCDPEVEFTIEGTPSCDISHSGQASSGCYASNPWGNGENPDTICAYYGLTDLGKDDDLNGGLTYTLTEDARLAVAHWGGADCGRGSQYYAFYPNAQNGDVINSPGKGGISFVVYCGCPTPSLRKH